MMGQAAPVQQPEQDANYGMTNPASKTSEIMSKIEDQLTRLNAPWSHLVKTDSRNEKRIEAPLQIYTDGFFNDYYTTYINDLWIYLSSNSLYVDASGASGTPDCVLKSQMLGNTLEFTVSSGRCPSVNIKH